MSLARGFTRSSSFLNTNVKNSFKQNQTFRFGNMSSKLTSRPSSFVSQRRQISLPKIPFGLMPEHTKDFDSKSVIDELEKAATDWNILTKEKDPATLKYPNFSTAARNILNECVDLLESIEDSSWHRADNPFAKDQLKEIKNQLKTNKSTLSQKEIEVVEPIVTKAQFVVDLWERTYFAFNILSDMYNRYHNQGEIVNESNTLKEIYEEYKDLYNLLHESKDQIRWSKPKEFTSEDIDRMLTAEEKEALKEYDDEVLAKVRYQFQVTAFDEFELVEQRINELLTRLDFFRGQSGIGFKGMDKDVFK